MDSEPRPTPASRAPDQPGNARTGNERTLAAAAQVLDGTSRGSWYRRLAPFLGPAFIASVAYVDPGNFATNIQGGAQYGYMLLWVIVASNLMAMLTQALSAKLGHRHREEPGGALPRSVSALGRLDHVGPHGIRRHGHRPGGVPGGGAGVQPALRDAALRGGGPHGDRHLRDPGVGAVRLPPAGGRHHVAGGRHRVLLRRRNVPRRGPTGARSSITRSCRNSAGRRACCWQPASWARR